MITMRKRLSRLALILGLALVLAGCSEAAPARTAEGTDWQEDWETLGPVLGVEAPQDGLTLLDNNTALSAKDLYYAAWTVGDPAPYTNAEGEETDLYQAQLDVLVCGTEGPEAAQAALEEWLGRAEETYAVSSRQERDCNTRTYTVLAYDCLSGENPYARGAAAFTVCGKYAVSMELNCRESFDGDPLEILGRFLPLCHYGEAAAAESEAG